MKNECSRDGRGAGREKNGAGKGGSERGRVTNGGIVEVRADGGGKKGGGGKWVELIAGKEKGEK